MERWIRDGCPQGSASSIPSSQFRRGENPKPWKRGEGGKRGKGFGLRCGIKTRAQHAAIKTARAQVERRRGVLHNRPFDGVGGAVAVRLRVGCAYSCGEKEDWAN